MAWKNSFWFCLTFSKATKGFEIAVFKLNKTVWQDFFCISVIFLPWPSFFSSFMFLKMGNLRARTACVKQLSMPFNELPCLEPSWNCKLWRSVWKRRFCRGLHKSIWIHPLDQKQNGGIMLQSVVLKWIWIKIQLTPILYLFLEFINQNHSLKKLSRFWGCPHFIRSWSKKIIPVFQNGDKFFSGDSDIRKWPRFYSADMP